MSSSVFGLVGLVFSFLVGTVLGADVEKAEWVYFTPGIWMGILTMLFLVFFLIVGVCLLAGVQGPTQFEEQQKKQK